MSNHTYTTSTAKTFLADFKAVTKMGLSISVVFSSLAGYLLAAEVVDFQTLILLAIGGYFMVGASNVFNQIIERDLDALMDRTKNRPIPAGRMTVTYAFILAIILTVAGSVYFIQYQRAHRHVWCHFNMFVHQCIHSFKNKNPALRFCGSHSRSDSFYVGMGGGHWKIWN